MNNVNIFPVHTEFAFWETALDDVLHSIHETLQTYDTCRIGLAGGSTPRKLYAKLAEQNLDWDKITWISIDERYVPSDHPESNLRMLRETLFAKAPVPPNNIIAFDTSLPPMSAAKEMGRRLIDLTHERSPIFDLLILGAGADGHVASLFEGDSALQSTHYAEPAKAPDVKTEQRITCTLISLSSADRALLLLKGPAKQTVVDSLQGKGDLPLTALQHLAGEMPIKVLTCTES